MSALTTLERACAEVAAPGTDPGVLAALLAWSVLPRRTPDALRRQVRDDPTLTPSTLAGTPEELRRRVVAGLGRAALLSGAQAADAVVAAWRDREVRVAVLGDPAYPDRLAEGWPQLDPPVLLAVRGRTQLDTPAVAIVGSRRPSGYGTAIAAWLAEAAGAAGVRVVSGGALGIDAAAHRAALAVGGRTDVVLGCGHAVAYPRGHAAPGGLFAQLLGAGGVLVSELLPWEPPRPGPIRARNRIVAGLTDVVVVVEGGARSGALLTAGAAAERGRTVLAVPGDVRAPGSVAPHRLLAEGADPCTGPDDLLAVVQAASCPMTAPTSCAGPGTVSDPPHAGAAAAVVSVLPAPLHAELARRWPRPARIDDLAAACELPVGPLLAALTRARVAGELAEDADGVRLRRQPGGRPRPGAGPGA